MRVLESRTLLIFVASMVTLFTAAAAEAEDTGRHDWPAFRGPFQNGISGSPEKGPVRFGEKENVTWKTAIPHAGWSTPVLLDGKLWLTTATEDGRAFFVIRVNAETGETEINKQLFHAENPEPLGNNVNTYASPTAVLEPDRAYVHFGSYGTACLDTDTADVIWERRDLPCRHYRGPGSSPVLFENLLILTFDGVDVQYVAALDKESGQTVWKTDRSTEWDDLDENGQPEREGDYRKAFCTPLVIEHEGKKQLISPASEAAFSYDPYTGKELWFIEHNAHSASPMPVYRDGVAYICLGHRQTELWAVSVDGGGNVTDSHVRWRAADRTVPKQPSPLLVDGLIYMVSNEGAASCYEAETGREVWRERVRGNYMASPVYAGGRIYFASTRGTVTVIAAGREYRELAVNEFDEPFLASPALSGKTLYLRSRGHLYRIEEKE
jgi:outer membrane protein assembly factor BamB